MIFLNTINVTALSGIISPTNLGTGSGGSTKFLREDGTFQNVSGSSSALSGLSDVTITNLKNQQSLVYNTTTSKWENNWRWFDYVLGKTSLLQIPVAGGTVHEMSYTGTIEKRYRFVPEPYDASTDIIYKNYTANVLLTPLANKLINI
jgi:DNA-binding transcriptional regulator PaaX